MFSKHLLSYNATQPTMMKSILVAAAVAGASAFAPAQVGKTSTSLNAFENEIGAMVPVGFRRHFRGCGKTREPRSVLTFPFNFLFYSLDSSIRWVF